MFNQQVPVLLKLMFYFVT